jgi:hypothetical protein
MGSQTFGHAQERRRVRGRRGGSVPLGFAKREGKRGVQNWRGHVTTAIREKTKMRRKERGMVSEEERVACSCMCIFVLQL